MKPATELFTTAHYVTVLKPHLPANAFRPDARHLFRVALQAFLLSASYYGMREAPLWTGPFFALLAGSSIACLGFLAHDVSHHSVVRSKFWTQVLELFLFGVNLLPPTMWKRVHIQTHHAETNTVNDPDRRFMKEEHSLLNETYIHIFHPGKVKFFPRLMIIFGFIPYIVRNVYASFLEGSSRPSIVPAKPSYTSSQRLMIFLEIVWIALVQCLIFEAVGGDWLRYFMISPVAVSVASGVGMAYIYTQHFLNPHCAHTDPVVGSTSIIVPTWLDWFHNNFSYHTEHHVFPGMNPSYYPLVSRLLLEHFPDRYQRITFYEAWCRLWKMNDYVNE